jgi:tellurite resistance protein TehA-like permease
VVGGSLAISALTFAEIAVAAVRLDGLTGIAGALKLIAFALWVMAMLWLVPLVLAELRWPRLGYHSRRWSTVFPLGMYAAMSFAVAAADDLPAARTFALAWTAVAAAVWAAVALAATRAAAP